MPKPACPKCQRFFRPKKNGYILTEGMPVGQDLAPAGRSNPELWKPYKVWEGDLWECLGCGAEIVVGYGNVPISEHYKPEFNEINLYSQVQINDC